MVSSAANADEQSMWKFIKSLNGTPDTNSPNEVLMVVVVVMAPHYWGASRALMDGSIAACAYVIARAGLLVKIPSSKAVSPKTRCRICVFAGQ